MMRRAFTIVELMVCIGIISVLLTLTVVAVAGSIRSARLQRAEALCTLAKQALETYNTQKGEWPWGDKRCEPMSDGYFWLTAEETRDAFKKIVLEAKEGNPMMDISGLFVSDAAGEPKTKCRGMDFFAAVHGTKRHPTRLAVAQLQYGYQNTDGNFRRFVVKYAPATDTILVRKFRQDEEDEGAVKGEG